MHDFGNIVLHANSSLSIDGSREGEDCRLGFAATPAESVLVLQREGLHRLFGRRKSEGGEEERLGFGGEDREEETSTRGRGKVRVSASPGS
jgi:hypothetical protein